MAVSLTPTPGDTRDLWFERIYELTQLKATLEDDHFWRWLLNGHPARLMELSCLLGHAHRLHTAMEAEVLSGAKDIFGPESEKGYFGAMSDFLSQLGIRESYRELLRRRIRQLEAAALR